MKTARTDPTTLVALALIGVVLIIFAVGTVLLALRELEVPEVISTAIGAAIGALATYLVQQRQRRRSDLPEPTQVPG